MCTRRINFNNDINAALFKKTSAIEQSHMDYAGTHGSGVRNNAGNISWTVHRRGVIRPLLRKFYEPGDLKREALTVDHMPVECIDLRDKV
jgi:hypothetical protein